jgi:Tfp pilus assembly protein PilO
LIVVIGQLLIPTFAASRPIQIKTPPAVKGQAPAKSPAAAKPSSKNSSAKPAVEPPVSIEVPNPITEAQAELSALVKRLPSQETEIIAAIAAIKNELRLRELRWRTFHREAPVEDENLVLHPVRIELVGTYERLTDLLLTLAAFNYLIVVDEMKITRAKQPAPLVSLDAEFTLFFYSVTEATKQQLINSINKDSLETLQTQIERLNPRFSERVVCWTALNTIGRNFPKSPESVLRELSFQGQELKLQGISRFADQAERLAAELTATQLFTEVNPQKDGPNFNIQAQLAIEKSYQQWLEGNNTETEFSRDPFITSYTLEQLVLGSGANVSYPPLEKRLAEYRQRVSTQGTRANERLSAYLVSEVTLMGLYFTPELQGAVFRTPEQKEVIVRIGARCYNGKFTAIQQNRALFEELLTRTDGQTQINQVVKPIDSATCATLNLLAANKTNSITTAAPVLPENLTSILPATVLNLNVMNLQLNTMLQLIHELSNQQFNYVIDQNVPTGCITITRERLKLADMVTRLLQSNNLIALAEAGIARITIASDIVSKDVPVLAFDPANLTPIPNPANLANPEPTRSNNSENSNNASSSEETKEVKETKEAKETEEANNTSDTNGTTDSTNANSSNNANDAKAVKTRLNPNFLSLANAPTLGLAVTDLPLSEVIKFFAQKYQLNLVVTEACARAKITATITDVPWPAALQAILRASALAILVTSEELRVVDRKEVLRGLATGNLKLRP